jgi:hypothetical protein
MTSVWVVGGKPTSILFTEKKSGSFANKGAILPHIVSSKVYP